MTSDELEALFVMDERITYSSEKQGLLRGPEAMRQHHLGFGFVPGGKVSANALWLEQIAETASTAATLVTAIWCFRRASTPDIVQRGPLSRCRDPHPARTAVCAYELSTYSGTPD